MKRLFSILKKTLLWMVHHPRIATGLGVLVVIVLIWGVGVVEKGMRSLWTMGVLLLWSLFLMWDQYRIRRREKQEHAALLAQGQRPLAIQEMSEQFEKGLAALQRSKLGQDGKTALYALPWYMVIGPPGSGKSTVLEYSGLPFPQIGGGWGQGVGGTRHCDWWFTDQAVLLDMAGRYVIGKEDREEWLAFLALLKKHRKSKPINGVLAAVTLSDLLRASEGDADEQATSIRARIDDLIARLGVVFPVYLLLTKCDLIRGFVDFFEDLSTSEREDILGVTLPLNLPHPPKEAFLSHWDGLVHRLKERRLVRLAAARGNPKVKDIYTFPAQLASGKERLSRFVEILFQSNPYQENPIFRGFYLTSGTQEGTPIDPIRVEERAKKLFY